MKISKFLGLDEQKVLAIPLVARDADRSHPASESKYFQIKLAQMSLEKGRQLFSEQYPVVHSDIQFGVIGGKANATRVISPEVPGLEDKRNLSRVLVRDQSLSDTIVYRGGPVQLSMGLFSAPGDIWADRFFELAKMVTSVTGSISLGSAVALAEPVTRAIEDLTRTGAMKLMIGLKLDLLSPDLANFKYLAVIGAQNGRLEKDLLNVSESTLFYDGRPLDSVDFMLLGIEFIPQRTDLSKLAISRKGEDLVRKSAEFFAANISQGDSHAVEKGITKFYQYFIAQVFSCEMLTLGDRNRLIGKVREKIMEVRDLFRKSENLFRMRGGATSAAKLVSSLEKNNPEFFKLSLGNDEASLTDFSEVSEAMNFQLN